MPGFTQAEPAMSCAAPAIGPCEIVLYRDPGGSR